MDRRDTIASASADRTVRVWRVGESSLAGGALPLELTKLATLSGHTDAVQALILLELEALLGHVKPMFVFLLELLAKVVLDAPLLLFHAAIRFHLVALT